MIPPQPIPRSIFASRLADFPEFVFADQAAYRLRGTWRDFFRQRIGPAFDGRIILEIGCHDAAFISRIAAKHPRIGFVGLDWKFKAIFDAAQRVEKSGPGNLALLRGRGQEIARLFNPGEVDEIWLFHPDPCDREVERNTRLLGESFLHAAADVLRDERSILALKTDHAGYYQDALALFGLRQPQCFPAAPAPAETAGRENEEISSTQSPVGIAESIPPDRVVGPGETVRRCFEVTVNSADFWNDATAREQTKSRCFSGEQTMFEKRFIKRRFPICYLEMRKKTGADAHLP